MTATDESSESVLVEGEGKPLAFAFKNGTFYILLQRGSSWRMKSLVLGDGSLPVSFARARGKASGLELRDGVLFVNLKDGSTKKLEVD